MNVLCIVKPLYQNNEEPSRSGPGPLAPQAKPVRPRTLGPPSQAGPAQDPWPKLSLLCMTFGRSPRLILYLENTGANIYATGGKVDRMVLAINSSLPIEFKLF